MKAGKFNIKEYLEKLHEAAEDGGVADEGKGIHIPPENRKSFDWLRKEYDKGKKEVKVEMSSHEFKPGYSTEGAKDFEPGLYKQSSDAEAAKFPETKFPDSETKGKTEESGEKKKNPPKVEAKTKEEKEEKEKEKIEESIKRKKLYLKKRKLNEMSPLTSKRSNDRVPSVTQQDAVFNRHLRDFPQADFTIEFNVKNPYITGIPEDIIKHEFETGEFTNEYGDELFQVLDTYNWGGQKWEIKDWSFAGRSSGWYALLCAGDKDSVRPETLSKIETIVTRYFLQYNRRLKEFYNLI